MDNLPNKSYKDFNESDFICDPFFQDWIIKPSRENEQYWNAFLLAHPEKKEAVENAGLLLKSLRFKEDAANEIQIQHRFADHLKKIESAEGAKIVRFNIGLLKKTGKVAAVIGGVILLAYIFFLVKREPKDAVIATNYGEMKRVYLPDSTYIVLNAHSQIRYRKSRGTNQPREIWLDGEAFFDVKHLNKDTANVKPNERFLVHGSDVTVEVLGTSFDIRQRRGNTEVVLQSGRIKLSVKNEEIIMQPGEWVVYNSIEKRITRSVTVPENYTAWKEKKLLLNNPTVEEIAKYLEDIYGKKIVFEDTKLRNKKIEGPILLDNLDDALFVISTVLNIKIEQKDSLLILHSKQSQ